MPETPYVRPPGYAEHYRDRRFRAGTGPRTHAREAAALQALLVTVPAPAGPWLDVPSGTGRMSGLLPGRVVQVDRALPMLQAGAAALPRVRASAACLPFADATFAGALCLRLLHHLADREERRAILAELARVVRGPVLLSFFDSCSLQHLRRLVRRRFGRPSRRVAIRYATLCADLQAAGLRPVGRVRLARFLSEQTLVAAIRSR